MNIEELKALAEKATPGPWGHEEIDPTDPEWGACEVFTAASDNYVATHVCKVKDAAYIAAANPAAILELIAQLEDAQSENRALLATEQNLMESVKELEEGLRWYGEQSRLCRLIHAEGDAGRYALSDDGGKKARALLEKQK